VRKFKLKSDDIVLFEGKRPILVELVINKYYVYQNYDEYKELFQTYFNDPILEFDPIKEPHIIYIFLIKKENIWVSIT